MKNILFIILIVFSILDASALKIDAVLIDVQEIAYKVKIKIRFDRFSNTLDLAPLQKRAVFYNSEGQKFKLKSYEIKSIHFSYNGLEYNIISVDNQLGFSRFNKILLHRIQDGYLKRYRYYEKHSNGGLLAPGGIWISNGYQTVEIDILQKGDGLLYRVRDFRFKKHLSEYFQEYPGLSQRIATKELTYSDINLIVNSYNAWYESKKEGN